jgi:hypothetical protein
MEPVNAFIGHFTQPSPQEIAAALGATAALWQQLIDWLAAEHAIADREWKSTSPKYGWSLLLKLKKRTIVYLGPCDDCFRASFILGDKAVAAARASDLPKSVVEVIDASRRYAEGTGVRLLVKRPADLAAVRKLAQIKLAN